MKWCMETHNSVHNKWRPIEITGYVILDQHANPTFHSRYAHIPFVREQSEGPKDTVAFHEISPEPLITCSYKSAS